MERRDYVVVVSVSLIAICLYFKPDIQSVVKLSLQSLVMAVILLFICNTIGRLAHPLKSRLHMLVGRPVLPAAPLPSDGATAQKMQESRENAQQLFQQQAADYVERILKPRQEEKRRKQETRFNRFFSHTAGEGHVLGSDGSSSSQQYVTAGELQSAEATRRHRSNLLDRLEEKTELADEPELGGDGVVTLALRTPDNQTHKRRFTVSDAVKNVVAYMEAVGYSHASYSLLLPYPRQCISDRLDSSLCDVGISADSTLIVDLND